ncbi:MAG: VWA domain-containing protein [Myxococcales bacterium]|nr:VWA domain-containing protein [Myxococcales bacterium]
MTLEHPGWLLLVVPSVLLWWHFLGSAGRLSLLRLMALLLVPLALSEPRMRGAPDGARTFVLLDRSRSVRGAGIDRGYGLAVQLRNDGSGNRKQMHVIGFGDGASLLVGPEDDLETLRGLAEQDDSSLSSGLRLTQAHVPQGEAADVILVSDGLFTGDDPMGEVTALRSAGIRVHVLDIGRPRADDTAITQVQNPSRAVVDQVVPIAVEVTAPSARPAVLRVVDHGGRDIYGATVHLRAGPNRFGVPVRPSSMGTHTLTVVIEVEHDSERGNNSARAALSVVGPPRVLVLNPAFERTALARALTGTGLAVEMWDGSSAITSAGLQGVVALVLENMPLDAIGDGADRAIERYVRYQGGGLLVTGGRQSYAMGGYFRSRLEKLLPVAMDRREELRRPKVDMAVVLDRSGSMGMNVPGGSSKMDMANLGAAEAISLLAPGDRVSVLAVDTVAHRVVPLTEVSARNVSEIRDRVMNIEPGGGGIFTHTALAAAMDALLEGSAPTRHIVLFADAADAEQPGDYQALVQRWTEAGGSLSVIGLGTDSDPDAELLRRIAVLGNGRAYLTSDPLQLPRVFAQDVMHVARRTFIEEESPVLPASGLLGLSLPLSVVPSVAGYNLSFIARDAELMLVSGDDNQAPLAAGWQRGAGKVMAVTFEADGPFTGPIADWTHYRAFFRACAEWVKQGSPPDALSAEMVVEGRDAVVTLEVEDPAAVTTPPRALIFPPGDRPPHTLELHWSGPTTLKATHRLESDGVYHGVIASSTGTPLTLAPIILPYSPEFEVERSGRSGSEILAALAAATGGEVLTHLDSLQDASAPSVVLGARAAPALLVTLLLLMLIDIAARRGLMGHVLRWLGWEHQWRHLGLRQMLPKAKPHPKSDGPVARSATSRRDGAPSHPEVRGPDQTSADAPASSTDSPLLIAKRRARGQR